MLSVIIPVYNYDASALIGELGRQGLLLSERRADFALELLVGDDASTDLQLEALNRQATAVVGGSYHRVASNMGRAAFRNFLADRAHGDWILMIDCDAQVSSADFLERYWDDRLRADVVCGALLNPPGPAAEGYELRCRYERAAEDKRPAAYRNRVPYACFTTFNVMFRRDVFAAVRFDERCTEYGYEDALMGLMLQRRGATVLHTDNALLHMGIDTNASFLAKTEAALRVLSRLGDPMQSAAGASRAYRFMQRLRLQRFAVWLFRRTRKALRRNLLGRRPSLLCFQLYKVGYYANFCNAHGDA